MKFENETETLTWSSSSSYGEAKERDCCLGVADFVKQSAVCWSEA